VIVTILTLVSCGAGREQQTSSASPSAASESQPRNKPIDGTANTDRQDDNIKWTEEAQAYSSIATLIVTLLGFAFLYSQIKQARQSLNGSTHAAVYGQQHAIHQYFIDHSEFRKYFYDNVNCDDQNRGTLLPVAEMFADFFEHLSQQQSNLPASIWPAWVRYMRNVYQNSPILREHFERNGLWYDTGFVDMITAQDQK